MVSTRRTVGVLTPMPSELKPVVRAMALRAEGPVHRGSVGSNDVVAMRTGIGMTRATEITERMLADESPDLVVVCGIAGGLSYDVPVGAVINPEVVANTATSDRFTPTPFLVQPPSGVLSCGDELILDDARLEEMRQAGIVALDMETAAVAAVCDRAGVSWSVVRAISDRPHDGLLDSRIMEILQEDGSADLKVAARIMARDPRVIRRFAKLGRGASSAARAAAQAAAAVLRG